MQTTHTYKIGLCVLLVFGTIIGLQGTGWAYPSSSDQQLLIPFYNYPNWQEPEMYLWDDIAAANSTVPLTVIINPDNGPEGCPPNSDYQQGISDLHASGVTILGYVYTSYAMRDIGDVQMDVDQYVQCYNIDGIFFDEASSQQADVGYYQALYDYVQQQLPGAIVVNNFGVEPHQDYSGIGSSLLGVFDGDFSQFMEWTPSEWVPEDRSVVFVYNTSPEQIQQALTQLRSQEMGWFYATSDISPNPWDTLPDYFDVLLDSLHSIPEPGTLALLGIGLLLLTRLFMRKRVVNH